MPQAGRKTHSTRHAQRAEYAQQGAHEILNDCAGIAHQRRNVELQQNEDARQVDRVEQGGANGEALQRVIAEKRQGEAGIAVIK